MQSGGESETTSREGNARTDALDEHLPLYNAVNLSLPPDLFVSDEFDRHDRPRAAHLADERMVG